MAMTVTAIKRYVLAGKAIFTIYNSSTRKRFTYRVTRSKAQNNFWFVSVLTGPNNTKDYSYVGIIIATGYTYRFQTTKGSRFTNESTPVKAFYWFWNLISQGKSLPSQVKFTHSGYCGRCGRKLTTPSSIRAGMGPVCLASL